ncbi:MAG: YafY family transcriptional regulator [Bacteroidales bacterium]|nr:YafY family transcriptional regulator [Bacteroidales bacterium]
MNRIDRLTAIIVMLQSKKVVTASEIADKYSISVRTVYRDIRALEEAGVPIGAEAGIGYYIIEGYSLPPVMFTREEAGSILVAEKLCEKFADKSTQDALKNVTDKIRSVLPEDEKEFWEHLESHTHVLQQPVKPSSEYPNHFLSSIQQALHNRKCLDIEYYSQHNQQTNQRIVEPVGICFYSNTWHMIAYCRFREEFRDFRIDRIKKLNVSDEQFISHAKFSLSSFFKESWEKSGLFPAIIHVKKSYASALSNTKYYFGLVDEKELDDVIEMSFMINDYDYIANWILSLHDNVVSINPEELSNIIKEKVKKSYKLYVD